MKLWNSLHQNSDPVAINNELHLCSVFGSSAKSSNNLPIKPILGGTVFCQMFVSSRSSQMKTDLGVSDSRFVLFDLIRTRKLAVPKYGIIKHYQI